MITNTRNVEKKTQVTNGNLKNLNIDLILTLDLWKLLDQKSEISHFFHDYLQILENNNISVFK